MIKVNLITPHSVKGSPHPPSNVMVVTNNFQPENFSIIISWETVEYVLVDEYRIEINTTTQSINTNTTSVVLEGKYNIPLEINISAINCVGSSAVMTEEVNVGMLSIMYDVHTLLSVPLSQLAVLLPLHLSMVVLMSGLVPW